MTEMIFNCKRCGTCCRSLLEYVNSVRTGLLLTPKEINLFPFEMVSPKLAVGIVKPDEIISYQLNVDTCPHLDEKNECKIYYGRPLICKAFPYISGRMSRKCPQIGNQMIIETDLWAIDAEIEASKKLDRYILNRTEKLAQKRRNQKVWEFDLAEKKWIFRKSLS